MSVTPNRQDKIGIQLKTNQNNPSSTTTDNPIHCQMNGLTNKSLSKEQNDNQPIHSTNEQSKQSSLSSSTSPKTEAQIEYQKDQPLYRRQPSKPLDNSTIKSNSR